MELVNFEYIKIEKIDIFNELLNYSEANNDYMKNYFQKLLDTILKYEKESKKFIKDIYLHRSDFTIKEVRNMPIKRQTVINAYVYANIYNDVFWKDEIGNYILKKEVTLDELFNTVNYILEHSIDINEYFDGEIPRYIYNSQEDKIDIGYIFKTKKDKVRKLKIK